MSRTRIMVYENSQKKTKKTQKTKNPLMEMSTNTEDASTSETGDTPCLPSFGASQNPWTQHVPTKFDVLDRRFKKRVKRMDMQLSNKGKKTKMEVVFKYKNNSRLQLLRGYQRIN